MSLCSESDRWFPVGRRGPNRAGWMATRSLGIRRYSAVTATAIADVERVGVGQTAWSILRQRRKKNGEWMNVPGSGCGWHYVRRPPITRR